MSSRLDPTVEQQIGALPLPTKRSTRVAESQGESFTIFKFGQSMESVYHIRVLRKEVDLLAAADLRERMSKMTAGDGGNPAGTFAVLDQYETTAIHLGFYKEVQRNVLGKMMGNHTIQLENGDTFEGPYAGVLGWPSQCGQGDERCWPDADKANMEEIMKGQKEGQKEGRGFTSDLAAALRRVPAH